MAFRRTDPVRAKIVIDGGTVPVSYTHLDVYKRQHFMYIFLIPEQKNDIDKIRTIYYTKKMFIKTYIGNVIVCNEIDNKLIFLTFYLQHVLTITHFLCI